MGAETDRRESARALMSGGANQSMEPTGVERHRRSPQVSFLEKVNGVSGKRCDIDAAKRRAQPENWEVRVNQSKPKLERVPECPRLTGLKNRSRRESNPHLRFRKPLFYPLNYGNKIFISRYLC